MKRSDPDAAMNAQQLETLMALLAQPTAPFREYHVRKFVSNVLTRGRVPFFEDPVGNLVVGAASAQEYAALLRVRSAEPVRLFIAHMDHPGFHGVRWTRDGLQVKWHGGSPVRHLNGSSVWLATDDGWLGQGTLRDARLAEHGKALDRALVRIAAAARGTSKPSAAAIYGGFGFRAPVWRGGRKLYTKAADDLVGVFAVLQTALALYRRGKRARPPFLGLLSRAEEVGFVGTIGHLELGWYQQARRPLLCVSLEASRTLPGALVGSGPVVRLGDRRTVFDANGLQALTALAQRHLPKAFQRRVMDGGACEGTAATAYGIPTIALSVPLGNYHNQGFEGGPDCRHAQGPAPEFVHLDDVAGLLKLCKAVMSPAFGAADAWSATRRQLRRNFAAYRSLL